MNNLLMPMMLMGALASVGAPPNFIFILADDLGWTDLGCQGSRYYETPNIDRLAAEGIRFTAGYAGGANCQPTRACLMTGQYNARTGVYTVGGTDRFNTSMRPLVPVPNVEQLALEKVTIAEALKSAGYATGIFGKWHLGEPPSTHGPAKQGFDEAIASAGRHFNFKTHPKVDVPADAYLADFLTEKALAFIDAHKGGPFLLYLPHFAVHSPWESKADKEARFKEKPPADGHDNPVYAGMIASLDDSVGRVLEKIETLGIAENTLVIFSSDNGGVGGYDDIFEDAVGRGGGGDKGRKAKRGGVTSNAPLRGGKGMFYEGGIRVPYVFRWKGTVRPGATSGEPIHSVDLYPTLLELAGTEPPAGHPIDGTSYADLLKSGGATKKNRTPLFWHFPGYLGSGPNIWRTTPVGAIRKGDYKLLEFFEDGRLELYNLARDEGEKENLATRESEIARDLHGRLNAWRERLHAPMPRRRGQDQPP